MLRSRSASADEGRELPADVGVEIPANGALLATVIGFRFVRDDLEPSHCRICDGAGPGQVNSVDDWFRSRLRHHNPMPANVTSYVLAFGLVPASAVTLTLLAGAHDKQSDNALVDVLAIAEGGLSAMLATEVLESVTLRTRPYVHAIASDTERNAVIADTGAFHSFPSGHVVLAFGLASASGVVSTMRGYRLAPVIIGAGLALGLATSYTRIAADRHYFTDTLAGAGIGTLVGGGVPFLLHRPTANANDAATKPVLSVAPMTGGSMLTLRGAF